MPPDQAYAPSRPGGNGELVRVNGQDAGGRSKQSTAGPGEGDRNHATRLYSEAYADYNRAASSYLDEHYIPLTLKDYVRDYFVGIAPESGKQR